ncbi:SMC-Scp complex subunit ScpB [Methylocystis sp. H62]|uniref:SMC-Scp complex subunit ScpB n=1 Tax=Methylocystis sp. H62 TaxID=2785789 RepID=UPI00289F817A|nr:SMC-Scp complex subunit ScpB [Methylocystis sp. H62]
MDGTRRIRRFRCARSPVAREALSRVVGSACNLDDLISDIRDELRTRPCELVFVAGGYQLRTKPRFAPAIRAAGRDGLRDAGAPELTPTEILAVTAIAYLQPATRAGLSRLAGRAISRDVIGALKRHGLIDGALRAPEPGAPFAYVTTKNSWRSSGSRRCASFPTSKGLKTKGSWRCQSPRPISMMFCSQERWI